MKQIKNLIIVAALLLGVSAACLGQPRTPLRNGVLQGALDANGQAINNGLFNGDGEGLTNLNAGELRYGKIHSERFPRTDGYLRLPAMPSAQLITEWEVGGIILTNNDVTDPAESRIHIGSIANLGDKIALYYGQWTNKTLTWLAEPNYGTIKMAVSTNINDFNNGKLGEVVTAADLTSDSGPESYKWVSGPSVRKIDNRYWMVAFAGTNDVFESETSCGVLLYSDDGTNWVEAPSSPYVPFAVPAGVDSYNDWDVRNVFSGSIMKIDDLWYIHYVAYANVPLGGASDQYMGGVKYATSTNPMVAGSWVRAVGDWVVRNPDGTQDLANQGGNGSIARLNDGRWLLQMGQRMAISTNSHPTNFVAASSWLNTDFLGWDVYWGFSFIEYDGLMGVWDSHKGPPWEVGSTGGGDYLHLLLPKATAKPVHASKLTVGPDTITSFAQIPRRGWTNSYRVPHRAGYVQSVSLTFSESPFFFSEGARYGTNVGGVIVFQPHNQSTSNFVLQTVWHAPNASYPATVPLRYATTLFISGLGRHSSQTFKDTNLIFTAANQLLTNIVEFNTGTNALKELSVQIPVHYTVGGPQYIWLGSWWITELPNAE